MINVLGHRIRPRIDVPVGIEPKVYDYANKVLETQPGNLIGYWPFWEGVGPTAFDQSPEGNNGTYSNVTLNQPGIGDGRASGDFNGVNSLVDVYSLALNADFDPSEGSLMVWCTTDVWAAGHIDRIATFRADDNNRIFWEKPANNTLRWIYQAGGVQEFIQTAGHSDAGFMCLGMSWSVSAGVSGEVRAYKNGIQEGPTQTGLGVWVGALTVDRAVFGASTTGVNLIWDGLQAHAALWGGIALTPAEFLDLATL